MYSTRFCKNQGVAKRHIFLAFSAVVCEFKFLAAVAHWLPKIAHIAAQFVCDSWPTCLYLIAGSGFGLMYCEKLLSIAARTANASTVSEKAHSITWVEACDISFIYFWLLHGAVVA